ncbi:P-II family nitrogen regulator [Alkalicella caledoniensis]|uniref:P-II family nitrogen regulator n=1 Tax=Alkalicella caledoniensis TaxID=2731377 RepID=A0A7G9WAL9_ALKCA|nr:P-II family nitrogen regulator [Alkalicella caledoniensis]QNO15731.1 P-II family nitrogen regulator [Alkalicella caledoniensis]
MSEITGVELLWVIVRFGLGSKILKCAKESGIKGGTVFLGKGTIQNSILQFLELSEVRREIVLMAADSSTIELAVNKLDDKFKFYKPNHGIAFTTSLRSILGTKNVSLNENLERGVNIPMYNVILTIVDRGKGQEVVEAANKAGSRGATIINGRGSGIHETNKLFAMEIEPEKELVLIISQSESTEAITESIKNELKIDEPGNGVIFIQDVEKTYGLY